MLAVDPNQELRWGGHLLPGLLDGIHRFELLEQRDGTTLLRQSRGVFAGCWCRWPKNVAR
ncbi:MAG: hypothetical protein WKG07_02210 [Hymenobacter sp.]